MYKAIISQITGAEYYKHKFFYQKWSAELATVAQNFANNCNATVHNQFRHQQAPSFQSVGENMYILSSGTLHDYIYLNII